MGKEKKIMCIYRYKIELIQIGSRMICWTWGLMRKLIVPGVSVSKVYTLPVCVGRLKEPKSESEWVLFWSPVPTIANFMETGKCASELSKDHCSVFSVPLFLLFTLLCIESIIVTWRTRGFLIYLLNFKLWLIWFHGM